LDLDFALAFALDFETDVANEDVFEVFVALALALAADLVVMVFESELTRGILDVKKTKCRRERERERERESRKEKKRREEVFATLSVRTYSVDSCRIIS